MSSSHWHIRPPPPLLLSMASGDLQQRPIEDGHTQAVTLDNMPAPSGWVHGNLSPTTKEAQETTLILTVEGEEPQLKDENLVPDTPREATGLEEGNLDGNGVVERGRLRREEVRELVVVVENLMETLMRELTEKVGLSFEGLEDLKRVFIKVHKRWLISLAKEAKGGKSQKRAIRESKGGDGRSMDPEEEDRSIAQST